MKIPLGSEFIWYFSFSECDCYDTGTERCDENGKCHCKENAAGDNCCAVHGVDYKGSNIHELCAPDAHTCSRHCDMHPECKFWTFWTHKNDKKCSCWLKNEKKERVRHHLFFTLLYGCCALNKTQMLLAIFNK